MHTLEPEYQALHTAGHINDATASRAVALDRGLVFSLHDELRVTLYAGVLLVITGAGMILARNLDRIGPMAILLLIALAAAVCAIPAIRARAAGRARTVAADYLLLLAALLGSAALGYAERQFTLLGAAWSWHLLWLAVVHAAIAGVFASPRVLAVALTSLAGWFGVGGTLGDALHLSYSSPMIGSRALACAAVIAGWRFADRRLRPGTTFSGVFDQFAANLAFWGAIAWCLEWPWLAAGLPLLAALAYGSIRHGLASERESFLVYGVVYAAIGVCVVIVPRLHGITVTLGAVLFVVCAAAAMLWQLRRRLRQQSP